MPVAGTQISEGIVTYSTLQFWMNEFDGYALLDLSEFARKSVLLLADQQTIGELK